MDCLTLPLGIAVLIMLFMLLWFCINFLVWSFTDTDKPFPDWLGITK